MIDPLALTLALLLDAVFGEPKWLWNRLPHPAILMGRAIGWFDKSFNRPPGRRIKGVLTLAALLAWATLAGLLLQALPGIWAEILCGAILLAQRSLSDHVREVALALDRSLQDARHAVSMIVSRDTSAMEPPAIARSAIESAAENLSDGVIAPLFWFAVAGLPGLLVYKITNTADSMIGYRTERHEEFGWAAARFDDLLNLIPARLTALLIWLTGGCRGGWAGIIADARRHKSPNAGWPEAALSRALGIALAGPRSYDGVMRDFPYVNADGRLDIGAAEIRAAVNRLWRVWGLVMALAVAATAISAIAG